MNYQQSPPSAVLCKHIKCYWNLENDSNEQPSRERVFPDGCIELLFHYADPFVKFDVEDNAVIQPRCFIHGQIKKFIELEATGKTGIFSVRFHAAGLQPFIDFDVSEITDTIMVVSEIWKTDGPQLENEMLGCSDNAERIATIEAFLLSHMKNSKANDAVAFCANTILASNGTANMEQLAAGLNVGKRHLERNFLSHVGLGQKLFSRIVRFNHTLQLIENKDFQTFTTVAYDGGFYDQAHFIKDFKKFTGLNPKQYFSENLEMAKYFNLG